MSSEDSCFVPTKGSQRASGNIKHEVFEYASSKSKRKSETVGGISKKKVDTSEENVLNVIKLKQEVARFGMSGLAPKDEKEAKIQLAIKLGAKPPKNKYKNYKVLIEERKKSMQQEKREKHQFELRTQLRSQVKKSKPRIKPVSSNLLGGYGRVNKDKIKEVKAKR